MDFAANLVGKVSGTAVTAYSYAYNQIPGAHYLLDAVYTATVLCVVTLPALLFVGTLGLGVGTAIIAAMLALPVYFIALFSSLEVLGAFAILVAFVASIDMLSDLVAYLTQSTTDNRLELATDAA